MSQFVFYAGKGGVGKTTCAAASAVALAARGDRVLVLSTDPAHSLGDVFGTKLSRRPRQVRLPRSAGGTRRGALHAAEIDARRAFKQWLAANRRALGDIVEHGTWLDRHDVNTLLGLSIPGIDELIGLIEIDRLTQSAPSSQPYDYVIVDTAPTGHALRLLAAPETVSALAQALDALQDEHRLIRDQLARIGGGPDAADRLIEQLMRQASETAALVRDRGRATFHWVTLPEDLSLSEAEDGILALTRSGVRVRGVVVNRAIPEGARCPVCDRRRAEEQGVIDRVQQRIGAGRRVQVVPAEPSEPHGVSLLQRIGQYLTPDLTGPVRQAKPVRTDRRIRRQNRAMVVSLPDDISVAPAESFDLFRGVRLLFLGGNGGVGKTTVAAAVALRLARADPTRRVLLLSTDPAHSLADVLGQPVGDRPSALRRGPRNLHVREVNAAAALASRRAGLESALNEIGGAFGAGGVSVGGGSAAELMELAPPGIDELFGLISVFEGRAEYPLIVVDTAPTGHALRLLEMPEVAREWVQAILRVLLKYRALVKPGQLAADLVQLSKSIRELQTLLREPRETRFAVVTRAAAVPRIETVRLVRQLRRLHLAVPAVIVNALTLAPGRCPRCRMTVAAERHELTALTRHLPGRPRSVIIQTPLAAPPPRGPAALERWARSWTSGA